MKSLIKTILKFVYTSMLLVIISSNVIYADTIEIRNGMKTTYADKKITVIDTVGKNYNFKWALDKKGNWRLYLRKLNGRLISLSNVWVSLERKVNNLEYSIVDYYYFDMNGYLVTGWYVDVDKSMYYLDTDPKELGKMARGWTKIGNSYYYFDYNGVLLKDTITPDGFHVDASGRWK